MRKKVIITGGGTGGHLMPMITVAEALSNKFEVIFFASKHSLNSQLLEPQRFKTITVLSGKIHRFHNLLAYLDNLFNLLKFGLGLIQAFVLLVFIRPAVVFSKGGYGSLPTVIAAHALKIPVVLHESDLSLGLANRLALKYATKIGVSFPPENYNLPLQKIVYTGHILRKICPDSKIRTNLDLNKLPVLLVTGGSQGALAINKNLAKILPDLLKIMNVIHLSGDKDFAWLNNLKQHLSDLPGKYYLESFSSRIIDYMSISDLIVSRAGSNSLAEIVALRKPAIIIPYRWAAAGHQEENARFFQKKSAIEVISESDLTPELLKTTILGWINDKDKMHLIAKTTFSEDEFNGVNVISELIEKTTKQDEQKE